MGFRVAVWDDRPEVLVGIADEHRPLSGSIADAIAEVGVTPSTSIVVVTRNVALDVDILPPLLAAGAGYVGLMGSRRRWATTRAQLETAGVPADLLDVVRSPIGIEIGAETPEEIALSILAEVVSGVRAA
jgi:xanthine dehydrogenase accessory factor